MRVVVIHYDIDAAIALAGRMRREGFEAEPCLLPGTRGLRVIKSNPPDAILIDLMRMPSYGRAIGALLREQKATRHIPLVFLEGEPEKTELVKALLPDAEFAPLSRLAAALKRATRRKPESPVVPEPWRVPAAKK